MGYQRSSAWMVAWCCATWCLTVEGASITVDNPSNKSKLAEAQEGTTVTLPCPSNDDDHRFLFWQLDNDEVIGPLNPVSDRTKYKYEVLSGDLYIKVRVK